MGKISSILIIFVFINIIGYLLMSAALEDGFGTQGQLAQFNSSQTFLGTIYAPLSYTDSTGTHTTFVLAGTPGGNDNTIVGSVPTQTPEGFIQQNITFVDRIFAMFAFIRVIIGILLFPIALSAYIGLPYQLTMLFIAPLTLLYIVGFFDLLSGGSN